MPRDRSTSAPRHMRRGQHARGSGNVTSLASHGPTARASDAIEGAVALKQEAQHDLSPTEKQEALQWSKAGAAAATAPSNAAPKPGPGYEGEVCSQRGHFLPMRNGTGMKCDTCGSKMECS
jgi:ribonucleoside-diphosphate reductase alpha chain